MFRQTCLPQSVFVIWTKGLMFGSLYLTTRVFFQAAKIEMEYNALIPFKSILISSFTRNAQSKQPST